MFIFMLRTRVTLNYPACAEVEVVAEATESRSR